MKDFAVITTGGKQYRVSAGDKVKVEKLASESGSLAFDKVLLRATGGKVEVGAPYLKGAAVEAKLLRTAKDKTKIVFRFHSKTRYRKKKGHRQEFSEVEITRV
jgi:large subunit ribosomal protein L21